MYQELFFQLGSKTGVLNQLYARSRFALCHEKFLTIEEISQTEVSLRTVALTQVVGNGQDFIARALVPRSVQESDISASDNVFCVIPNAITEWISFKQMNNTPLKY